MLKGNDNRQDIWSILSLAILVGTLFLYIYVTRIFINLSITSISIYYSLFFITIVLSAFYIIKPEKIIGTNWIAPPNVCYALSIVLFMMVLTFSYDSWIVPYARTFPLLEIDNGLGWHRDTAFHVSLIRSIMNWGYPSIALDGHPWAVYHSLSHYIDALFFSFSRMDPLDSYGMTFLTKCYFLIASCFIFVAKFSKTRLQFLLSGFIFSLVYIASWHAVGSHALWSESIILIISSCMFVDLLLDKRLLTNRDYLLLVTISLILCLGKISTGFAFICIYFSALLFREYKQPKFYFSMAMLFIFIFFYQELLRSSHGLNEALFKNINYSMSRLLIPETKYQGSFYIFSAFFLYLSVVKKELTYLRLLFSSISTNILFFIITYNLNYTDRFYFYLGYYSVFVPIVFVVILRLYNQSERKNKPNCLFLSLWLFAILLAPCTFIAQYCSLTKFAAFYKRFQYGTLQSYNLITKNRHNLYHPVIKSEYQLVLKNGRYFKLREALNDISTKLKINKSEMSLFIPNRIVEKQLLPLSSYSANALFYAMNIYSITGVPLLYSLSKTGERGYGFNDYDEKSMRKNIKDFDWFYECKKSSNKAIVILNNFNTTSLEVNLCS